MGSRVRGLVAALVLTLGAAPGGEAADAVRIGWTAWADAEFVTRLARRILEQRMGQEVELVQTDIAPQYQGVASGDIDVMLMAWLPGTHADYMEKVGDEVVDLGILYDHARLGWIVPDYIPESAIGSIGDLRKDSVRARLGGRITGIDPGAGLTRLSKKAIHAYGLDGYDLRISSGAGMTASLARAIRNEEWIVVTGWSPHWKFGAWDLRYLDDPKGVLGSWERIHAVARSDFYQENIDAATMLARMWIPLEDLQAAMHDARRNSYEQAVTEYIAANEKRVRYWVTGEM